MDYAALVKSATLHPDRLDYPSAWIGHVPFSGWLMRTLRPAIFVELGTHFGVSYFNFCQAAKSAELQLKCYAVDTWKGDVHTGPYGEEVFVDVSRHNERNYADISRLLRMRFDDAVTCFSDSSIDLLHIDGCHTYEAVKHDFETWLPRLTPSAVVLFHDTNVREKGFGVWRLWEELIDQYPLHLEFQHSHGLGVIQLSEAKEAVSLDWLRPGSADRGLLIDYFGVSGAAAVRDCACQKMEQQVLERGQALAESHARIVQLQDAVSESDHEIETLQRALSLCEKKNAAFSLAATERDALLASTSWRFTQPLRDLAELMRRRHNDPAWMNDTSRSTLNDRNSTETARVEAASAHEVGATPILPLQPRPVRIAVGLLRGDPAYRARLRHLLRRSPFGRLLGSAEPRDSALATAGLRVVYVSGESHWAGHEYRVARYAVAARHGGARAVIVSAADSGKRIAEIRQAHVVVIWRAAWSDQIAKVVAAARAGGARVVFDVDDLMVDPSLVRTDVIDGIRTQGLTEAAVRQHYRRIRKSMEASDYCTCPTEALGTVLRKLEKPTLVLPNGFDDQALAASRSAVIERRSSPGDGLIRIGYAAGTRTHQKDFVPAANAVARILRLHANCRLVLFSQGASAGAEITTLDISEFPAFQELEDRIEVRPLVPIRDLPRELARFDVNLAPLEVGNPYCEAKSELKFFEAALAGVPTVASPTEPFRFAIRNKITGFLAVNEEEWFDAINQLISDPALRTRVARDALHDVLWRYGPERRADDTRSFLAQVVGHPPLASDLFERDLYRSRRGPQPLPEIPDFEVVYLIEAPPVATAAVVMPVYNYAHYVTEALESVKAQTLKSIELIVVDDRSTDDSLNVVHEWLKKYQGRFRRVALLQNKTNSFLGLARNAAFAFAESPLILPLDPDNKLLPRCLEECVRALEASGAAMAYPMIEQFGDGNALMGTLPWSPSRLALGNYIDAMALVRKAAWAFVGGYETLFGWEDYDLWCKFAENGLWGVQVPEILAHYRLHGASMLQTYTHVSENEKRLYKEIYRRHPWLDLVLASKGTYRTGDTFRSGLPTSGATESGSPERVKGGT